MVRRGKGEAVNEPSFNFERALAIARLLKIMGYADYTVRNMPDGGNEVYIHLTEIGEKRFTDMDQALKWATAELTPKKSIAVPTGPLSDYLKWREKEGRNNVKK